MDDIDPEDLRRLRAPPWTTDDQLLLARSDARAAAWSAEDEANAAKWRAIMSANPHPGPGGWRMP